MICQVDTRKLSTAATFAGNGYLKNYFIPNLDLVVLFCFPRQVCFRTSFDRSVLALNLTGHWEISLPRASGLLWNSKLSHTLELFFILGWFTQILCVLVQFFFSKIQTYGFVFLTEYQFQVHVGPSSFNSDEK